MVQTCTHESYIVGIICALAVEKAAVEAMLEEEHSRLAAMAADDNSYSPGRTGEHHVVVACLPAGVTGKASTVTWRCEARRQTCGWVTWLSASQMGLQGGVVQ
ncbi:hypothetical protein LTR01_009021 [Friedmanniomyces endolithicus]|nr:hypothetical protein LTR01_009021 [Friedmanniomyces endolithicus]KAK0822725.1 hypothetical protein LTR73_009080 [Friedmanniomyces endolithicus]